MQNLNKLFLFFIVSIYIRKVPENKLTIQGKHNIYCEHDKTLWHPVLNKYLKAFIMTFLYFPIFIKGYRQVKLRVM